MIPTIGIKVAGGVVKSYLGFVGLYEAESRNVTIVDETITITGSITDLADQITLTINVGGAVTVKNLYLVGGSGEEVDEDDETAEQPLKAVGTATAIKFRQTAINTYNGCFAALGVKSIQFGGDLTSGNVCFVSNDSG